MSVVAALSGVMHGTVLPASVLSLTMFSDGMFVERELLRRNRGAVIRSLGRAMPITLVLLALVGKALFPALAWAEGFLLGAVLSPTDPVVTSAVVT